MTICSRALAGAAAAAGTANSWSPRAPFHRCVMVGMILEVHCHPTLYAAADVASV